MIRQGHTMFSSRTAVGQTGRTRHKAFSLIPSLLLSAGSLIATMETAGVLAI
jgi:hypothetical protein